jgi:hypothetical protein
MVKVTQEFTNMAEPLALCSWLHWMKFREGDEINEGK